MTTVDWSQYDQSLAAGTDQNGLFGANGQILLNNSRYDYNWIPSYYTFSSSSNAYLPNSSISDHESRIRPGAMAAAGLAVMLKTNLYGANPAALGGATKQQITTRNARLIKGLAQTHVANGGSNTWGNEWQSALWAAEVGQAGWMMWDDLDATARQYVVRMVEHEANRFLEPGYEVPFWDPSSGDSKAEENAWNSMIMQTAVAMMPNHPYANQWRRIGSELMVTAFSRPSDQTNAQLVNGRTVADWIDQRGYNAREDGVVINHNRIHPDYMATTSINTRAYLMQSLAGQTVSQAGGFNADVVWRALVQNYFDPAQFQSPGGTIYRPGQAEVYYPQGNDWSSQRVDIYYLMDAFADVMGYDAGTPDAAQWMAARANYILALQARPGGSPGQTYRPGDWYIDWVSKEQQVAWQMSDAYLLQWLNAQGAVMNTGNWIPPVFVDDPGFEDVSLNPGLAAHFSRDYSSSVWRLVSGGNGNLAGVQNGVGVAGLSSLYDPSYYNGNHKSLFVNSYNDVAAPIVSQTLDVNFEPHTLYSLSVDVASRGLAANDAESYEIELLAGDTVLAQLREGDPAAPLLLDGQWVTVSLVFDPRLSFLDPVALLDSKLEIRLTNPVPYGGSVAQMAQTLFDNVTLRADLLQAVVQGDVNFDGVVDIFDVNVVSAYWGNTGRAGDANGDGVVDIFDVNLVSSHWGATGGAAAVPEPTSVTLAGIACCALLGGAQGHRIRRSRTRADQPAQESARSMVVRRRASRRFKAR